MLQKLNISIILLLCTVYVIKTSEPPIISELTTLAQLEPVDRLEALYSALGMTPSPAVLLEAQHLPSDPISSHLPNIPFHFIAAGIDRGSTPISSQEK